MAMRLPGIGSQYLFAMLDSNKEYFDGAKTYKVTLPKGIPEANFWSFTLYDNQTRSMLDTPQRYPRAGSQSYPSPAAEADADGSTTVYFGPTQPGGVKRGNWIQTMPEQGLVHDPAPLQPARTVLRQGVAAERDRIGEMTQTCRRATTGSAERASQRPADATSKPPPRAKRPWTGALGSAPPARSAPNASRRPRACPPGRHNFRAPAHMPKLNSPPQSRRQSGRARVLLVDQRGSRPENAAARFPPDALPALGRILSPMTVRIPPSAWPIWQHAPRERRLRRAGQVREQRRPRGKRDLWRNRRTTAEQHSACARAPFCPTLHRRLEMAALPAEVRQGDVAIMPSLRALRLRQKCIPRRRGAVPVFNRHPSRHACNLDERLIEAAVTPRTR